MGCAKGGFQSSESERVKLMSLFCITLAAE